MLPEIACAAVGCLELRSTPRLIAALTVWDQARRRDEFGASCIKRGIPLTHRRLNGNWQQVQRQLATVVVGGMLIGPITLPVPRGLVFVEDSLQGLRPYVPPPMGNGWSWPILGSVPRLVVLPALRMLFLGGVCKTCSTIPTPIRIACSPWADLRTSPDGS